MEAASSPTRAHAAGGPHGAPGIGLLSRLEDLGAPQRGGPPSVRGRESEAV